jgi:hypothetical protein
MELTRSPMTAVLIEQQVKVHPKPEQQEVAAEAREEISSDIEEQGIEMKKTQRGLVAINNWIASRTRSNQGKASGIECARGEAGRVKSTPAIAGKASSGSGHGMGAGVGSVVTGST